MRRCLRALIVAALLASSVAVISTASVAAVTSQCVTKTGTWSYMSSNGPIGVATIRGTACYISGANYDIWGTKIVASPPTAPLSNTTYSASYYTNSQGTQVTFWMDFNVYPFFSPLGINNWGASPRLTISLGGASGCYGSVAWGSGNWGSCFVR